MKYQDAPVEILRYTKGTSLRMTPPLVKAEK